jgi:Ice-binding-like
LEKTGMRICLRREERTPTVGLAVHSLKTRIRLGFFPNLSRKKPFLRRLIVNHHQKRLSACLIALAALFSTAPMAWAVTEPALGTASSFGALGGSGVSCDTPPALLYTVNGDVGTPSSDLTLVTGFAPPSAPPLCTLSGTVQDATTAYDVLFTGNNSVYSQLLLNNPCPTSNILNNFSGNNLSGDLGGMILPPGVYCLSANGVTLNGGTLTLDPNAPGGDGGTVWIFIGQGSSPSSITTDGTTVRSQVVMASGGDTCKVYWALASALTLSSTDFVGNVLAGTAVTFTGSSLAGRAFAEISGVTGVTMTAGSSITGCGVVGGVVGGDKGDGDKGDGDKGDGNGNDKDKDKDKDHKDYSRHSFKDVSPFDMDEQGGKK